MWVLLNSHSLIVILLHSERSHLSRLIRIRRVAFRVRINYKAKFSPFPHSDRLEAGVKY